MLDRALNVGASPPVLLRASPDRFAAGQALISQHPELEVVVLDDGFQHRRLARDLDIVLINAAEPFGFGHVLPRGMLREPLAGLSRAGAIVLTHSDRIGPDELQSLEAQIRKFNLTAPLFRAAHVQAQLRSPEGDHPLTDLSHRRFFAFCGIGNPLAFEQQLNRFGPTCAGHRRFGDHHDYSASDLRTLSQNANDAGAELLITTEKDWAKIERIAPADMSIPIWRVDMKLKFSNDDEDRLLELVRGVLGRGK
jgi:tetraacyldisaccharide 4'-kinase